MIKWVLLSIQLVNILFVHCYQINLRTDGIIATNKQYLYQYPQLTSIFDKKTLSQQFMEDAFRKKPIIHSPMADNSNQHLLMTALQEGGLLTSLELYATLPELQTFVISQISNWVRGETQSVLPRGSYSAIFASTDGTRLVHAIGWKGGFNDQATEQSFNNFRKRASLAADGLPLDLKESTHIYKPIFSIPQGVQTPFTSENPDKYPLFSIDFFTARILDDYPKVRTALKRAVEAVDNKIPELVALHMLSSTDKIVSCLVSTWTSVDAKESLQSIEDYTKEINVAKTYAIEGSISDIVTKSKPSRMYRVVDVYLP